MTPSQQLARDIAVLERQRGILRRLQDELTPGRTFAGPGIVGRDALAAYDAEEHIRAAVEAYRMALEDLEDADADVRKAA